MNLQVVQGEADVKHVNLDGGIVLDLISCLPQ